MAVELVTMGLQDTDCCELRQQQMMNTGLGQHAHPAVEGLMGDC